MKRKTINKMSVTSGSGRYSVVNGKLIFFSTTQTYDSDFLNIFDYMYLLKQSSPDLQKHADVLSAYKDNTLCIVKHLRKCIENTRIKVLKC